MKTYVDPTTGQEIRVIMCPPSKRKAGLSIQRKNKRDPNQAGANFISKERKDALA